MRITRTDLDPAKGGKKKDDLEAMDVSELQAKHKEVLGEETIGRNKKVLIDQICRGLFSKDIKAKREARKKVPKVETKGEGPTMTQRLEDWTTEDLQRELNGLTGRRALERDRAVLIRMITKLRQKKQDGLEAKAEAGTPTMTQRLVAIANMKLPELRETYRDLYGKPSLSRSRKALLVRIAERLQADEAAAESTPGPDIAKPTLTVPFQRKGSKKSGGRGKGRTEAKAAAEGKETAAERTTRPAGQRDARLPKPGTTIERVYKGKKLLVRVLEDGFEYDGKPYRSLSALAKHITGQIVNGYTWFQLGLPSKEKKSS